jgi:hypothetical protein
MFKLILIVFFTLFASLYSLSSSEEFKGNSIDDTPCFIQNKGQWNDDVLFLVRLNGCNAWITSTGVVFDYYRIESLCNASINHSEDLNEYRECACISGYVVKMEYANSSQSYFNINYSNKLSSKYNFFVGKNPEKWASDCPAYDVVYISDVYSGIDIRYYFEAIAKADGTCVQELRYDFIVHPCAALSQIRLKFTGQESLASDDENIILKTDHGNIMHSNINVYTISSNDYIQYRQFTTAKKFVKSNLYIDNNGFIAFNVEVYNESDMLIIDPLVFSTFVGGNGASVCNCIGLDRLNNIIIAGNTAAFDFPISLGAYSDTNFGKKDIFVSKLSPNASRILSSTFIGGSEADAAIALAIDKTDNIIITGNTASADFPATHGSIDDSFNGVSGDRDAFVFKLNPDGTQLVFSSFLGGSKNDFGSALTLDNESNIYITGNTASTDFPHLSGSFLSKILGVSNIFILKISPNGDSLLSTPKIGGLYNNYGTSISLDSKQNIIVTGYTTSIDFPVTVNAFQKENLGGSYSAVVLKFDNDGQNLLFSTYLCGTGTDYAYSVAVDNEDNIFIAGSTSSEDFPLTSDAIFSSYQGGIYDVFVSKLAANGDSLLYSTYWGGINNEWCSKIAFIESDSSVLLIGGTDSPNLPSKPDAVQRVFQGINDVFITRIKPGSKGFIYSTYLGGKQKDYPNDMYFDGIANIYCAGSTVSTDFPTTDGVYSKNIIGSEENCFVSKINIGKISSIDSFENSGAEFVVFPNPCHGIINIEYKSLLNQVFGVEIYDLSGNLVISKLSFNIFCSIDISSLQSGVYFVSIDNLNRIFIKY